MSRKEIPSLEELRALRWRGYAREGGGIGVRNCVLVIYTVKCAEFVARGIVEGCQSPDVQLVGFDGCTDSQCAVNLLAGLIRHPNVGAVLAVGLGCEYVQPERLAEIAARAGKPARWLFIQNEGGTLPAVERGTAWARELLDELRNTPRVPMGLSDLTVGAECGGSDFTSGLAGNVAVGRFFDLLVDSGGTAIFEEIVEAVGLDWLLLSRAANDRARAELRHAYDKMIAYCRSVGQFSVSPGNFAGGLSTIEEKSMGAIAKSGSRPIQGVVKISVPPPEPGLWLLDSTPDPNPVQYGITNPNDSEGLMDLISCGAHVVLLVTGRGSVIGSPVAPCLKITGNAETFRRMSGDLDFDASPSLTGELRQDEVARLLAELIAETAAGKPTKAEALGHREFHIPYKYQEKEARRADCERR